MYWAVRARVLGREEFVYFAVLIPSIILHEVSHGAAALLFGDRTAQRAGRLTLNPVKHIDPFMTVLVPIMTALSRFGTPARMPVGIAIGATSATLAIAPGPTVESANARTKKRIGSSAALPRTSRAA